jgi:UDP-N-acetylglucosamine 2-epimerase
MCKVVNIVGARPQFVKASMVSRLLRKRGIEEVLLHTGQHYDFNMSEVFFQELGLNRPNHYLGVGSGNHGEQTGRMLTEIEKVLLREKPDVVFVYGDTNSTLAGALAAAKLHMRVAHVEAGLRSRNKGMPEEINRILADNLSTWLFCPTLTAVRNLVQEGFENIAEDGRLSDGRTLPRPSPDSPFVVNVGDVMFDVALEISERVNETVTLSKYGLKRKEFVLATIHRAENTDVAERLSNIWNALLEIAKRGIVVLFPIHPRTSKALRLLGVLDLAMPSTIRLVEPISYTDMIVMERAARVVVTDSGGIQKEAYFFETPCVIPREETEWVELIEMGWNVLTGSNQRAILEGVWRLFDLERNGQGKRGLYGDGKAAKRIVSILEHFTRTANMNP